MARINAETTTTLTMAPGSYRCLAIIDVEPTTSNGGSSGYIFTVLDIDPESTTCGASHSETVYGFVTKPGKQHAWVATITASLALAGVPSLPPVEGDVKPHQSFDWEDVADVQAICVGACYALTMQAESGGTKDDGTKWPDKLRLDLARATPAEAETVKAARAGSAWQKVREEVGRRRTKALEQWRKNLTAAPAAGSGGFADDDIPF